MRPTISYVLALIASTFLMGSSFVSGKLLLLAGFAPLPLLGWRFLVAAAAALPLLLIERHRSRAPPRLSLGHWLAVILIGLLQTAAVTALLFVAMRTIPPSTAAILLFTNPILVALLGRLFLGEALSVRRTLGLVAGILGVTLAVGLGGFRSGLGGALVGELIALSSALCWAVATILNKRVRLPIGPWALNFWQMLAGALALLILAEVQGKGWPKAVSVLDWGWFLWLAIPASTGSFGLWFVALRRGGATRTSGYLFLVPLFTVLLSAVVLKSGLTYGQAAGGTLIGAGLWLINSGASSA